MGKQFKKNNGVTGNSNRPLFSGNQKSSFKSQNNSIRNPQKSKLSFIGANQSSAKPGLEPSFKQSFEAKYQPSKGANRNQSPGNTFAENKKVLRETAHQMKQMGRVLLPSELFLVGGPDQGAQAAEDEDADEHAEGHPPEEDQAVQGAAGEQPRGRPVLTQEHIIFNSMDKKVDVEFYLKKQREEKYKHLHTEDKSYKYKEARGKQTGKGKFKDGFLQFSKKDIASTNRR